MKVIAYQITLLEPALLTALEGDPNESVSLNYVPGSVLRGAVIGKYMRARNLKNLDAAEEEVRRLFFDGTTRYLNGYPVDRKGNRTLPVPLSWQQEKKAVSKQTENYPAPIYDFALQEEPTEAETQGVKAPFCTFSESTVRLVSPERQLTIHTARNRRYGRAIRRSAGGGEEPSGTVYRYEALAAGQTFAALVLCDRDEDAELLRPFLAGEIFLGGSRSAGYGRARIHDVVVKTAADDWREVGAAPVEDVGGRLIVTFLSDALLRDENGQFTVDPRVVTAVLKKKLGIKLPEPKAFVRAEAVGGFNRKWGLPLPQALAVKMGSVFVYHLAPGLSCDITEKLLELEAKGIGERRAEGFGRLSFNWQQEEELEVEPKVLPNVVVPTISDEESRAIAERMVVRLFERSLERKVAAEAVKVASILAGDREKAKKLPSAAQISRLRNIIRNELINSKEDPNLERVKTFLRDVERRKAARKQFEKARVEGRTLLAWLNEVLNKTDMDNWKELFGVRAEDFRTLGGVGPRINDSFCLRCVLRYTDAVLAAAVKQGRKKEESEQ